MTDEISAQEALRGASDGLLIAIREVAAKERLKRGVLPADPGFVSLARDVRLAAEEVLRLAREEETRATEASESGIAADLPTIEASRLRPDLAQILTEWRAVERLLEAADPASVEASRLMERFEALRERYATAVRGIGRHV